MGYEWVSSIVILVILAILIVGWLPRHTLDSMTRVVEHREDKYSPSLHLIDAASGTCFSDSKQTLPEGGFMRASQVRDTSISPERVRAVRQARHKAVKRRQVLALVLLVATAAVLAIAFPLHFSPLFALIPAFLLIGVLCFGAHASRQARQWESKLHVREKQADQAWASHSSVSQSRRSTLLPKDASKRESTPSQRSDRVHTEAEHSSVSAGRAPSSEKSGAGRDGQVASLPETPTDVMPKSEIQQVVAKGKTAESERRKAAANRQKTVQTTQSVPVDRKQADAKRREAKQDLISFSLGEEKTDAADSAKEPQSLEIKSMRQVAVATPKSEDQQIRSQAFKSDASVAKSASSTDGDAGDVRQPAENASVGRGASAKRAEPKTAKTENAKLKSGKTRKNDSAKSKAKSRPEGHKGRKNKYHNATAFHSSEESAEVEVPQASSDSLGEGLEAILDRRQN